MIRALPSAMTLALRGARCPVAYAIDGVHVYDFEVNDRDPQGGAAIEWYAGPAELPAQFSAARKHLRFLRIWLK